MMATRMPSLTTAMTLTNDYRYRLAVPGGHATCRIRVYALGDDRLCLATERHDRFSGSFLADNAIALEAQMFAWHGPPRLGQFTWIEHDENLHDGGSTETGETFAITTTRHGPGGATEVSARRPTDRTAVEALLGQPLGA